MCQNHLNNLSLTSLVSPVFSFSECSTSAACVAESTVISSAFVMLVREPLPSGDAGARRDEKCGKKKKVKGKNVVSNHAKLPLTCDGCFSANEDGQSHICMCLKRIFVFFFW